VLRVAAGGATTCAILSHGNVRCWGAGNGGLHGLGHQENIGDYEAPASAGDVSIW
jgi:hypothetical protein